MDQWYFVLAALLLSVFLFASYGLLRRIEMEMGIKIGTTVWIEHTEQGDITHRVKLILERQPSYDEFCKFCGKHELTIIGRLIQHGILDHKIYAVAVCNNCQSVTAFIYHVEARDGIYPEEGHDQPTTDL